ncbi:MAG: hypothetical protein ACYTG4_02140 [Planctomycetota bacterium]
MEALAMHGGGGPEAPHVCLDIWVAQASVLAGNVDYWSGIYFPGWARITDEPGVYDELFRAEGELRNALGLGMPPPGPRIGQDSEDPEFPAPGVADSARAFSAEFARDKAAGDSGGAGWLTQNSPPVAGDPNSNGMPHGQQEAMEAAEELWTRVRNALDLM